MASALVTTTSTTFAKTTREESTNCVALAPVVNDMGENVTEIGANSAHTINVAICYAFPGEPFPKEEGKKIFLLVSNPIAQQ